MGEARVLMDRVTAAATSKDLKALEEFYAPDAVVMSPDQGEIRGVEGMVEWFRQFADALSDITFEPIASHEAGNVAIDEGYFGGTHTGPLALPTGESIEPTGRQIRVRSCDIVEVRDGLVVSHRFY
ncbi:MAG: ester cyclase, partial [Micromonosporaceae bacterium]